MPLLLGLWHSEGAPPDPDPTPPPPVPPVAQWPHLTGRTSWWVVNKDPDAPTAYVRVARLWTCQASGDVALSLLNGIGTCSAVVSLDDPSIAALTTADGRLATTQNTGVEVQLWRDGSLLGWWVVTNRDTSLDDWNGTLQLANREQLLAWVNQGHANRYDWLDVAHWDPMADTAGKFDSSLTGWSVRGSATAAAVTAPLKDSGTAYVAQVNSPTGGITTTPDVGLMKEVPLEHSFPGGITYRLGAWYWMPSGGTGSGFYFEAALRFRYLPPGMAVWDEYLSPAQGAVQSVKVVEDSIARGHWTYISTDLLVPPNTGGRGQALLMSAEGSPDNPGGPLIVFWARPHIVRDDTFTAINYIRGDKVSTAGARLVAEASYAADTPYRGLQTSGAPADAATVAFFEPLTADPGNQRIHYRYPEAEHHNLWEIAQDFRRDGNVDAFIDCGAAGAVLRFTTRGKDQPTWPLAVDGLRGRIIGPSSDASKARSVVGVQDKTISEFDRPEGVFVSPTVADGAVVEEWTTAATDGVNVWDEAQRVGGLRQSSPQIVQAELPGEAQADKPQAGDFHRVSVQLGGGAHMASTPTRKWRTTAVSYNEERDVFKLELTDQVVDA